MMCYLQQQIKQLESDIDENKKLLSEHTVLLKETIITPASLVFIMLTGVAIGFLCTNKKTKKQIKHILVDFPSFYQKIRSLLSNII